MIRPNDIVCERASERSSLARIVSTEHEVVSSEDSRFRFMGLLFFDFSINTCSILERFFDCSLPLCVFLALRCSLCDTSSTYKPARTRANYEHSRPIDNIYDVV